MKKNLIKKLVLKKHTVASLNAEQLEALRGGNLDPRSVDCGDPTGGRPIMTELAWGCRG